MFVVSANGSLFSLQMTLYTCYNCFGTFTDHRLLARHELGCTMVSCTECGVVFPGHQQLGNHKRTVHPKHLCPLCPRAFGRRHRLRMHLQRAHAAVPAVAVAAAGGSGGSFGGGPGLAVRGTETGESWDSPEVGLRPEVYDTVETAMAIADIDPVVSGGCSTVVSGQDSDMGDDSENWLSPELQVELGLDAVVAGMAAVEAARSREELEVQEDSDRSVASDMSANGDRYERAAAGMYGHSASTRLSGYSDISSTESPPLVMDIGTQTDTLSHVSGSTQTMDTASIAVAVQTDTQTRLLSLPVSVLTQGEQIQVFVSNPAAINLF